MGFLWRWWQSCSCLSSTHAAARSSPSGARTWWEATRWGWTGRSTSMLQKSCSPAQKKSTNSGTQGPVGTGVATTETLSKWSFQGDGAPQCAPLRATRSGGPAVRAVDASDQGEAIRSSKCPPFDAPWKMRPLTSAPLKKCLELFSGCIVLSKGLCRYGFAAEAWDVEYNYFSDLSKPEVLASILDRIRAHEFSYVHLGTPCSTWSRARRNDGRGPHPLRADHANLFCFSQLSAKDQDKVRMGNLLLNISIEVFVACIEANVAVSMENPASSRIWLTPVTQRLLPFGTPWRKATSFFHVGMSKFQFA